MKIIIKINCLLLLCVLCIQGMYAQKLPLNFKGYSSREGLSSAIVYDILKDSFGFLWIATEDGLNRFDGTNFKVYRHDPSTPNGLGVNHITALYESGDGCIWIGTNGGGLCFYDKGKDSIFNYKPEGPVYISAAITSIQGDKEGNVCVTGFGGLYIINPKNKQLLTSERYSRIVNDLQGKISTSFFEDSKQNIWVGSQEGLYFYGPASNHATIFRHNDTDNTGLAHNSINKITEDHNGTIWLATINGLAMLLPDGKNFKNYLQASPLQQQSNSIVYSLEVDAKNRLWIGTEEGLDILDIATGILTNYIPDSRNSSSLNGHSVRSILIDKQGVYWVGTYRGGLNKYDENLNHFNLKEYNAFDPYGLRSPMVTSFCEYKNGVFIGTDGGGLQMYDRTSGLLHPVNLPNTVKNKGHDLSILATAIDRNEKLWIGTFLDGLYCYAPLSGSSKHYGSGPAETDLNNDAIFCLKEDRKGNIWLGTNGGGLNVIRPGSSKIDKYLFDPANAYDPARPGSNYIRSIEEDRAGNIWVGTFGSGISVFDPVTQQFSFLKKENSGLPSNYILAIKEDVHQNMWVGTSGNGIGLLKKGNKQFELLTEKDGLANGTIHKIIEDAAGKIWISTNSGLSCYELLTGKFKNYSSHNGLQAGAFMFGAGLKLSDGELFFGGQNGFNHFNPSSLKTNKNIPEVVLTSLKVDNQLVPPSKNGIIEQSILLAREINLKYKQGFSIAFEALDFTVSEANQCEYQLKGFDKNWVSAGKEHSAYYSNLPPGEYTFQVRGSNNDGMWNRAGRSIKINVAPPYWRTNYAYASYLLLFAGILFYIRYLGIKNIKRKFALEQERQNSRQLIERERKDAEYLRKMDQMKIKFLTNLSHEFRTPISLIIGPVETLLKHIKGEAPLNNLNLIRRNARRLLNLVNQLLDFRKMEVQELKLQCIEDDIVFFIKDVCDSFNDVSRRKNISFKFYTELATLPVLFDHDKVERILFNLLSNAFKFTNINGYIDVALKEADSLPEEGYKTISVSISDSGVGIPKELQARIFENFFQVDSGSGILNQGTGIGLSITKEFVKMHDGQIWVDSEPGKGSTFTFYLKFKEAGQASTEATLSTLNNLASDGGIEPCKNKNGSEPSLLIVEDDDDFRFYLKDNLMPEYRIYEAANGREGWQRTLFNHPDIIVCDVQMPVMNGLELVQKLKADKRTKHIPVILLTAANIPNGTLDGLECGAIDYITKPFDFTVLQAKIHNILELNRAFKDTYSKQVTVGLPLTEVDSEKDKFLKKSLTYIYESLDNPQLSVELLSTHLCISRASLYTRLLDYTGMSPVEFIRSIKLEKAKKLLCKSDMTITEVSYETGFANPNYFAKVFKAKYNMTPSEFHEENRNKEGA